MNTLAKWSVDDYHRMIQSGILVGRRVELLNGDIVEMSPEGPEHYFLGDAASDYLKQQLGSLAVVRFDGPITLSNSEPEPDIAVVRPPKQQYRDRHPGPGDIYWLIEYANRTLARDLGDKLQIYAMASIQDYWVVDVQAKRLEVFRAPEGESYRQRRSLTAGAIAPLAFPEISLSVEQLLGVSNG